MTALLLKLVGILINFLVIAILFLGGCIVILVGVSLISNKIVVKRKRINRKFDICIGFFVTLVGILFVTGGVQFLLQFLI